MEKSGGILLTGGRGQLNVGSDSLGLVVLGDIRRMSKPVEFYSFIYSFCIKLLSSPGSCFAWIPIVTSLSEQ